MLQRRDQQISILIRPDKIYRNASPWNTAPTLRVFASDIGDYGGIPLLFAMDTAAGPAGVENVVAAVDELLVPVVPNTLSLRTLEHLEELPPKQRQNLGEFHDQVFHNREMSILQRDVPLDVEVDALHIGVAVQVGGEIVHANAAAASNVRTGRGRWITRPMLLAIVVDSVLVVEGIAQLAGRLSG